MEKELSGCCYEQPRNEQVQSVDCILLETI
jgi:hypothetical protein